MPIDVFLTADRLLSGKPCSLPIFIHTPHVLPLCCRDAPQCSPCQHSPRHPGMPRQPDTWQPTMPLPFHVLIFLDSWRLQLNSVPLQVSFFHKLNIVSYRFWKKRPCDMGASFRTCIYRQDTYYYAHTEGDVSSCSHLQPSCPQ